MQTHIKISNILKLKTVPNSLKEQIKKHPILGLKANQDEIFFKIIQYPKDGHQFYLKEKSTGSFIPFFKSSDLSEYIKEAIKPEKQYASRCCICGKKHNDMKSYLDSVHIAETTKDKRHKERMKNPSRKLTACNDCHDKSIYRMATKD